jgi:hypothetical protein
MPDLTEAISTALQSSIRRMHTMLPGVIDLYNPATQRARIRIAMSTELSNGLILPYPILLDVPVQFPRWGNYSITMPVTVGDECAVFFSERAMDTFLQFGPANQLPPTSARVFDLSDGFAVMGLTSSVNTLSTPTAGAMEIKCAAGLTVRLFANGKVSITNAGFELIALFDALLQQLSTETVTVAGTPTPLNGAAVYSLLKTQLGTFKV